jgi:hypothetical protein
MKSFWAIAIMGLLCLAAMAMLGFMGTRIMVDRGATRFVGVAVRVQERFQLVEAKVASRQVGMFHELDLHYQTSKFRSFDRETVENEMREVAAFAHAQIEPPGLRADVRKVRIFREEVTGGGCFEERRRNEFQVEFAPEPAKDQPPRGPELPRPPDDR